MRTEGLSGCVPQQRHHAVFATWPEKKTVKWQLFEEMVNRSFRADVPHTPWTVTCCSDETWGCQVQVPPAVLMNFTFNVQSTRNGLLRPPWQWSLHSFRLIATWKRCRKEFQPRTWATMCPHRPWRLCTEEPAFPWAEPWPQSTLATAAWTTGRRKKWLMKWRTPDNEHLPNAKLTLLRAHLFHPH